MNLKTLTCAALLAALPGIAEAAPVFVTFGGTYDVGQPLAGTNFTGSFAYDDATLPSFTGSYFGDGTVQQRIWTNFLTAPFTITNKQGTSSVSPADARLIINYGPYAGAANGNTSFDLNSGFSTPFQQFYINTSNNPGFATNGLPKATDFVLSPTLAGYGFNTGSAGTLTSLSATTLTASAVPEPATWGMMVAGFGLVGTAMRRRHAAAVAYA